MTVFHKNSYLYKSFYSNVYLIFIIKLNLIISYTKNLLKAVFQRYMHLVGDAFLAATVLYIEGRCISKKNNYLISERLFHEKPGMFIFFLNSILTLSPL